VTEEQLSTLFWMNVAVGAVLTTLCVAAGPMMVRFYDEPRLLPITISVGIGFLFIGAGAQHRAMLQRAMRFGTLGIIDTAALVLGIIGSIAVALLGQGYWALVVMTVGPQMASAVGAWTATRWIPGRPRRGTGVRSMIWYGGNVTFNSVIVYVAYNVDKVLIGRYWGAEALGMYGRAFQLINLPTDNLSATVSQVVFPALARLQNDPARLRSYFIQGYSFLFAILLPLTAGCALFPEDIVIVFLGARWLEAASIFRLLVPTILVFALINPLGWMLMATGRISRSVKLAILIAPVVIAGVAIGLRFGPQGVALGFSVAMMLLVVPFLVWATHGTCISLLDVLKAVSPASLSVVVAGAVVLSLGRYMHAIEPAFLRLVVESGLLFGIYWAMMLFGLNQRSSYMKIVGELGFRRARARNIQDGLVEEVATT
jgi:PST family polysaccharide transporter